MTQAATPEGRSQLAVGRLAPSPTGGLHLGHARTFLIAWLAARQGGGRVVLRIEDLDVSRVRDEARRSILQDLRWLGFDWDEGPDIGGPSASYVQSERLPLYGAALDRLKAAERVYPCTCTRADIERAAGAPHPEEEGPSYPGTCSNRCAGDADQLGDRPFAWRFRVPREPIVWDDLFLGPMELDPSRSAAISSSPARRRTVVPACRGGRRCRHGNQSGRPRRRPCDEHTPSNPALSEPRMARAGVRPCPARRDRRRPPPGQARWVAQAVDTSRVRGRSARPHRQPGLFLWLERAGCPYLSARSDRTFRAVTTSPGTVGSDRRMAGVAEEPIESMTKLSHGDSLTRATRDGPTPGQPRAAFALSRAMLSTEHDHDAAWTRRRRV